LNNDIKKTIRLNRKEWQRISKNLDDTNLNFSEYARDCLSNKKVSVTNKKYFYIYINDWWNFALGFAIPTIIIFTWFTFSNFNYILKSDTITIDNKIYIILDANDILESNLKDKYLLKTYKSSIFNSSSSNTPKRSLDTPRRSVKEFLRDIIFK
jgi:hypothetical protein